MESVLVVYVFYLSPSLSALNCLATMQANVGPMAAPSSSSSAAPPTNRSMSDGSRYSVDSSSQEEDEISRGGEDQEQAGLELCLAKNMVSHKSLNLKFKFENASL